MNRTDAKRDEQWVQSNREELLERMARALPEDGWTEALEDLFLARVTKPMESPLALYQPAFDLSTINDGIHAGAKIMHQLYGINFINAPQAIYRHCGDSGTINMIGKRMSLGR